MSVLNCEFCSGCMIKKVYCKCPWWRPSVQTNTATQRGGPLWHRSGAVLLRWCQETAALRRYCKAAWVIGLFTPGCRWPLHPAQQAALNKPCAPRSTHSLTYGVWLHHACSHLLYFSLSPALPLSPSLSFFCSLSPAQSISVCPPSIFSYLLSILYIGVLQL